MPTTLKLITLLCEGKGSTFRRRSNTYAKTVAGLQRTLDVHWIIHNFVRTHFTTAQVPAVAIGILPAALSLQSILIMQT